MQGTTNSGDADASEVEDEAASASDDEQAVTETDESDFEDEVAATKGRSSKALNSMCCFPTMFPSRPLALS